MASEAVATYLSEFMIIKIKPSMSAFFDLENLTDEIDMPPMVVGYLFHEWMHYLHNTYTLLGLVTFNHTIGLWKTFRYSYDENGVSGAKILDAANTTTLSDILKHWEYLRKSKTSADLAEAPDSQFDFSILSFDKVEALKIDNQTVHYIKCNIQLSKPGGDSKTFSTLIGTPEIIENLAWLIEDKLVAKLGDIAPSAKAFPYHAIEILARHLKVPTDNDVLIKCMIAALQTINPPGALLSIFTEIKNCQKEDFPIEVFLTNWIEAQFKQNELIIDAIFKKINSDFPVKEPIGLGIKEFSKKLQTNLKMRKKEPFFELNIINAPCLSIKSLIKALKKYGCCYILQEYNGQKDGIAKDKLFEVSSSQHDTNWQVFHAALKFIKLHIKNAELISLDKIPHCESNACPFYTVCAQNLRSSDPSICKTKPWESEKWYKTNNSDYCWYATAVCKTRPNPEQDALFALKSTSP